ncbi:MAG: PaaI family thioesterase [Flavobacteriales bacterium]|nr:PaaI family thioesterase [Flavobacteriales bacterium]
MSEHVRVAAEMSKNTLGEALGIEITRLEEGYVEGTMPVDHRTHQPYGLLHGGASAAFAETLGSFGSHMAIDNTRYASVGIEINCNHVRGIKSGMVTGKARLAHKGGKIHVWNIDITDENEKLICTGRLTCMIIPKP